MVLDQMKFIANAVRKQAKIAHLDDCQFIALKVGDIPEDIKKRIDKQYDPDYTKDATAILFARGPIDKKKREKIFNCVDKALGGSDDKESNANTMTVEDFKLLDMGEASEEQKTQDEIEELSNTEPAPADDGDEVSDEEIESIIGKDDDDEKAAEDEESKDPVDAHNEEVIGKALDAGKEDKDDEMDESVNEAGMSLADIVKKGNEIAAKRQAERDAEKAEKMQQKIKSIWIKEVNIDPADDNKSNAKLEITYMDGEVRDDVIPIGTTGAAKDYVKSNVSGEKYRQMDVTYDNALRTLKKAFSQYHIEPTDEDVRVCQIRQAFSDWRIKWYYGKDKKDDPMFAFSRTEADAKAEAASSKGVSKLDFQKRAKAEKADKGYAVYKNGNTTIYKTEAEDNTPAAMIHQGKSMAQWEKEFKGEFTVPQLVRMASSGTDLQRLLLTVNGHCTLDEAKEADTEKAQGEESKETSKAEDAGEENAADDQEQEVAPAVPMKWIFLKITLKK